MTLNRTGSDIQCTITNTHIPPPELAHLTVVKRLVPSEDAAVFDLLVDGKAFAYRAGDGGRTDKARVRSPGDRKGQRARGGWDRTGRFPDQHHVQGRHDSPVCGDLAAAPNLAIGKNMPAHARVGQVVPITITVKNVGASTAHGVRLDENPPLGRRLLRVGNNGSMQSDGTAVWHLGSLAPGQSRTVHAIARVTRAGLHLNTAVVTASNADPADAQATVRARVAARRPPPPPVTG